MKKTLTILGVSVMVFIGLYAWYLVLKNPEVPAGETVRNILPFGSGGNNSVYTGLATDNEMPFDPAENLEPDEFANPSANLFRLAETPVAGAVVFEKNSRPTVRYVDRATGHIYDRDLETLERIKITNNTLPKIYEAYFRTDGGAVLLRSLKDNSDAVENMVLGLTPPKATSTDALYTVTSTLLRGDISTLAPGSGNLLVYALRDAGTIVSSTFNSATAPRTILTSPFTDWRLAAAGNSFVMQTKASAVSSGFAYSLNTSNGVLTKILGPLTGLIAIPNPSGTRVLYSYVENGKTKLFAKNLANNALSEILPTTLAEKCVWGSGNSGLLYCGAPIESPSASEPDRWYRGETHFSDRLWLFDTNLNTAKVLAEPRQSLRVDIDVTEPRLSPDGDYLIFINKQDLSLWGLRLEEF